MMRMDIITAAEILGCATDGLDKGVVATGFSYDTRLLVPGDAFIGLKGEGVDGSRFVEAAAAGGASFFILNESARDVEAPVGRVLYVTDTYKAFFKLAEWWRAKMDIPFVGVTGSAGKTTVRNMIAHILGVKGKGAASSKNYNNHIGVPYTLCRIAEDDQWAVIEMGMNHAGEIEVLSRLARPWVGVLNGVEPAHIGFLGSLENIARAKLEIVEGIRDVFVYPLENEVLAKVMLELGIKERVRSVSFGVGEEADCRALNYRQDGFHGISFTLKLGEEEAEVSMGVLGTHNMLNAAAAALACKTLYPDLQLVEIARRLETFVAPDMRLNLREGTDGMKVIDDAYNANPGSMRAALEILKHLKDVEGLKVGVVLGDMFELGDHAKHYHAELARQVVDLKPSFAVAVGEECEVVAKACEVAGIPVFFGQDSAQPEIIDFVRKHEVDVVLVKGSRGVQLENVTEKLLA